MLQRMSCGHCAGSARARLQRQRERGGREPTVVPLERGRVCGARGRGQAQAAVIVQALQQLRYEVHGPAHCVAVLAARRHHSRLEA